MGTMILPFSADHVETAAALLAARHTRDRERTPELPATYGNPAATLPVLQNLLASDGISGVVALREGRVVAYLLGSPAFRAPTSPFAGLSLPTPGSTACPTPRMQWPRASGPPSIRGCTRRLPSAGWRTDSSRTP